MNIRAIYMKTDSDNLYWYIEYAGAIPNSARAYRQIYLYVDTDNSTITGYQANGRGMDYEIYFYLYGDNHSSYARLYSWNATSDWWRSTSVIVGVTRQPGLNYLEVWVPQQAVGYSSSYGLYFYMNTYAYTGGVPETDTSYVMGSHMRTIDVDGNAGDWGDTPATVTFPPGSTVPAELEGSALYIANDEDNLYFRIDLRGAPTTYLAAGSLTRYVYLYADVDNSNATGYVLDNGNGADYEIELSFGTSSTREGYVDLSQYTGTGEDWNWNWINEGDATVANGNILEASIPLTKLGLGTSGAIGLRIDDDWWYLYDSFPRPSQFIKFPVAGAGTTTGDLGIVKLFGSETVFLAVVVGLMLVEGIAVYFVARRGGKQPAPPPPP